VLRLDYVIHRLVELFLECTGFFFVFIGNALFTHIDRKYSLNRRKNQVSDTKTDMSRELGPSLTCNCGKVCRDKQTLDAHQVQ
jgi:hypothetical protein